MCSAMYGVGDDSFAFIPAAAAATATHTRMYFHLIFM